ncbi:MAG: RluA family pseudouridine synthase [Clostridia bacterium]|nr:RluA family pseudouridine synthase [Clostridia bacterium]
MRIEISEKFNGKTILFFLKNELCLSSKMITSLKGLEKGIMVNGCRVTVRHVLENGEVLELLTDDTKENENIVPTEMPLDIIYEDDDILVVSKPPMMPTHPSHGHFYDTLANAVCFHMQKTRSEPFVFRSVNRLDRNTSGLVLIAKNRISASRLYSAMQKGEIKKRYIALLDGVIEPSSGVIDTYIRRQKESIIFREVCEALPDASRAVTYYKTIGCNDKISVVCAEPVTGRTHQLRVHFAHMGASIIGDELYGKPSKDIGRHALHAYSLSFSHPKTKEQIELKAPLPEDIKKVLSANELEIEV